MTSSQGITVWIVNYRSSHVLVSGLLPLLASPAIADVVILDNGSPPQEVEALQSALSHHPKVRIVLSDQNLGFGGGHNRIAEYFPPADDGLIWLVNPDLQATPRDATDLAELILTDQADIVSPIIVAPYGSGEKIWYSGGWIDRSRGRVHDSILGRDTAILATVHAVRPTDFVTGAAPMLTGRAWRLLGGFREDLFLYWEDVDFSQRASIAGLRMAVAQSVVVHHLEGVSSKNSRSARANAYYLMSRNRVWVCRPDGSRGWGLLLGRGLVDFMRLIAYATLREGRGGLRRGLAVVRGGLAAVQRPDARPGDR